VPTKAKAEGATVDPRRPASVSHSIQTKVGNCSNDGHDPEPALRSVCTVRCTRQLSERTTVSRRAAPGSHGYVVNVAEPQNQRPPLVVSDVLKRAEARNLR
jgi:hypothetical protein